MQQQDPRIDRHRGAVYRAEDVLASVMASRHRRVRVGHAVLTLPAEVWFGELPAVQAFVDAALAEPTTAARHPGRGPVRVEPRRGHRRATYADGVIRIPSADRRGRWAMARGVVLHELAHHLADRSGHGPTFRAALLHLTELHVGTAAATLLRHLFEPLEALPDHRSAPEVGADQVRRVAALLAKAESTASAAEAEAYLAKAALVAQRHSIDLAVTALRRRVAPESPTHRMLTIGEPRKPLNTLLVSLYLAIARAWAVRVDIGAGSTYVLGYGMPGDLDQVESVFATASTVMVTGARGHVQGGSWRGTTYRAPGSGTLRPVTATVARNAFCLGFVERIGERMLGVARQARDEAAGGSSSGAGSDDGAAGGCPPDGPPQVALALRARELAVVEYHRTASHARGSWRGSATAAGSAAGSRRAGRQAADQFGRRGLEGGRPAIGG